MSTTGRQYGPKPHHYIGFYGCAHADRVVAVRSRPLVCVKPHHDWSWKLTCPACGELHVVQPLWRRCTEHEQRTRGEVQVPTEKIDPMERSARRKGLRTERAKREAASRTW